MTEYFITKNYSELLEDVVGRVTLTSEGEAMLEIHCKDEIKLVIAPAIADGRLVSFGLVPVPMSQAPKRLKKGGSENVQE